MSAPRTPLIRRGEALRWLRENGITEHVWRVLVHQLTKVTIGKRAYYKTAQIRAVFLNGAGNSESIKPGL